MLLRTRDFLLRHPALVAFAAAVACYAVTLGGTYVYDDTAFIRDDPRLTTPGERVKLFTKSYNGGEDNLYRPLVSLSYLAQHQLHGFEATWPWHAVNILLHATASALVAVLARRLASGSDSLPLPLGEGWGEGGIPGRDGARSRARRDATFAVDPPVKVGGGAPPQPLSRAGRGQGGGRTFTPADAADDEASSHSEAADVLPHPNPFPRGEVASASGSAGEAAVRSHAAAGAASPPSPNERAVDGRPARGSRAPFTSSLSEREGRRAAFVALAAGLIFAVHPVHSEVVAMLVGRAESMAAIAYLGGLILLLRRPFTRGAAVGVWACFVLAVASKEQGLTFPFAAALVWWLGRRRARPAADESRESTHSGDADEVAASFATPTPSPSLDYARGSRTPAPKTAAAAERDVAKALAAALCLTFAVYMVARESFLKFSFDRAFLDWTIQPLIESPPLDRWLIPLATFGRAVRMMLWPSELSLDYGVGVINPTISRADPYLWLGGGSAVVLVVLATALWVRGRRGAVLLIALGLATYGVASNVPAIIGTIFGERLLYLPSAFVAIGLAALLARVSRRVATPLLVALLALGALRTVSYVRLWDDRERIYAYAADTQPRSIRVRLLLGHELTQRQAYVEAERVLREAAALAPTYDGAYFQLAAMELHRGDFDRAAAFVGQARAIRMSMRAEMALREIDRAREVAAAATRPAR